jgi:hypothetical protein
MESRTREAVSEPESSRDLSRFLSACVDPHDGRLLPICCPLTFVTTICSVASVPRRPSGPSR